jgi:hypothetical protein
MRKHGGKTGTAREVLERSPGEHTVTLNPKEIENKAFQDMFGGKTLKDISPSAMVTHAALMDFGIPVARQVKNGLRDIIELHNMVRIARTASKRTSNRGTRKVS